MKVSFIFLISLACFRGSLARTDIVGGRTVNIQEVPYQAIIVLSKTAEQDPNEKFYCGAIIINSEWLTTAGHCVADRTAEELKVKTGAATKKYNDGEKHKIKRVIPHPRYGSGHLDDDIGLIQLAEPMKFSNVQKSIELATASDEATEGKLLIVSGYGRGNESEVNPQVELKEVKLPIISLKKCQDAWTPDKITENLICAGNTTDSACFGDSGGPGVLDGKLAAIISGGYHCNTSQRPMFFTAVNKYLDFIKQYVKNI